MTTIAYKAHVIAADSQETQDGVKEKCRKLFRVSSGPNKGHIIATAGATFSGMVFVDWYSGAKKEMPSTDRDLLDEDDLFLCLVLRPDGLFKVDKSCRLVKVEEPFYAIGHGAGIAIGAMAAGASAKQAVEIACKFDPYTDGPVKTARLDKPKGK